jgi:hypothetical protein
MFLIGLIWVLVNPECISMLYVIWETSVRVGKLLALQEGNAVGWMTKGLSTSFKQEKFSLIFVASRQILRPAQHPIQSVLRVKWLGLEANHLYLSSACVKNVWSFMCCTSTPLYTLTLCCLMKHTDSFTLYEVFSC